MGLNVCLHITPPLSVSPNLAACSSSLTRSVFLPFCNLCNEGFVRVLGC